MLEYEVCSRDQLVAAVKTAAQRTHKEALDNPVQIKCGSTKYTFKEGIHTRRADEIIAKIRATSKKAFDVK